MSITKNRQSDAALRALARAAFPHKEVREIAELTEGMFNAAYRLVYTDGSASILKIASADASHLLRNEVNLMQAEVTAMRILRESGVEHVPQVQFSDFSRSLCSGTYFFMEVMPGRSLSSCKAELPPETVSAVMTEVGQLQLQLREIRRDAFGLAGDERRFATQHALTRHMLCNVMQDAVQVGQGFPFTAEELLAALERDRPCFTEVRTAQLVHLDMWDGNVFVHEGRLSGVIDWERALWGDPLMDDPFRSSNQHPAFMAAVGKTTLTPSERRRILWYDALLQMTMLTESHFRQYGQVDWLPWVSRGLEETWRQLQSPASLP